MKKYFITGLVVLLPLALTIILVVFVFNLLTDPFAGFVKELLEKNDIVKSLPKTLEQIISQFITLLILFSFTIFLGMIGHWLFINYIIKKSENILERIPLISSIYNTCNDVIKTLFTTENKSFKQVVLIPYPTSNVYSIGFITRDNMIGLGSKSDEDLVGVFLPCTPNPTSGFLMMYKKSEIIFLKTKVEAAFKYIISCGVVTLPIEIQEVP